MQGIVGIKKKKSKDFFLGRGGACGLGAHQDHIGSKYVLLEQSECITLPLFLKGKQCEVGAHVYFH